MHFTRIFIGRAYTLISVTHKVPQIKSVRTNFNGPRYTAPIDFNSRRYNAASKNTQSNITTPLEVKIQEARLAILATPNRRAHTQALDTASTTAQILKKRPQKKKRTALDELSGQGFLNVTAFSTAEEYDLENLLKALTAQNSYTAKKFFSTDNLGVEQNVLYMIAKPVSGNNAREMFFFREGSVILWNFNETQTEEILMLLQSYEKDPYLLPLVRGESEIMPYTYIPQSVLDVEGDLVAESDTDTAHAFFYNGKFFLSSGEDNFLQKYTFSNAMATSIKLGIWEATLERYIDSLELLTEDLKRGRRLRISRAEVLRKTGELFALRHVINLSSDLLDTPDFYWDREALESLYLQVCSYFSITRRTKVMNEKINHCIELAELVSHNLNDAHHVRLEWMIIILIMVEVGFEIAHYMDRYYNDSEELVLVTDA